jgi:hypothetical protein
VLISSGDNFLAGPEFNASLDNGVPFYDTIGSNSSATTPSRSATTTSTSARCPRGLHRRVHRPSRSSARTSTSLLEPGLQNLVDIGRIAKSTVVTEVGSQQIGIVGATTPNLPFISSPRDVIVDDDVLGAIQTEVDDLTAGASTSSSSPATCRASTRNTTWSPTSAMSTCVIAAAAVSCSPTPTTCSSPAMRPGPPNGGTGYPRSNLDADRRPSHRHHQRRLRYIGRLIVGFDADGNLVEVDDESGPVRVSGIGDDAVIADPTVQTQVVDPVQAYLADLANNDHRLQRGRPRRVAADIRIRETNLGNLCADALLWTGRSLAGDFGVPLADVGLQNGGGIRNNSVIPAGDH